MHSAFAIAPTSAECRAAIAGRPEFRENRPQGTNLIVFNYDFCHRGTFPDPRGDDLSSIEDRAEREKIQRQRLLLRECRGLLFDNVSDRIVARRFHKFFNVDQNDENAADSIDWDSRDFVILEKYDGSLVSPLCVDWPLSAGKSEVDAEHVGQLEVLWGSKQGPTAVSEPIVAFVAEQLVKHRVDFNAFARQELAAGLTPLFEWCSLRNHIVLEYPEDTLMLTAIRDNHTGIYVPYDEMRRRAEKFNVPVTPQWQPNEQQRHLRGRALIDHFKETLKVVQNIEGYVICFYEPVDQQAMYKIKTDWYFERSRANSRLPNTERETWQIILDGTVDDILPVLSHRTRELIENFAALLFDGIGRVAQELVDAVERIKARDPPPNKKEFVRLVMQGETGFLPMLHPVLYRMYDANWTVADVRPLVIAVVKKNTTPKQFPEACSLLPGVRFSPMDIQNAAASSSFDAVAAASPAAETAGSSDK